MAFDESIVEELSNRVQELTTETVIELIKTGASAEQCAQATEKLKEQVRGLLVRSLRPASV